MVMLKANGQAVSVNEEGFLEDLRDWDEGVAEALAESNEISLTEAHWEVIYFMRNYYLTYEHFPNMRMFVKAVRQALGEEKGNSRYLHRLFPKGPLKYACKLAGLPKPPHCID